MDPSDTNGQLKRSAVPTDLRQRPSFGQQPGASIPQGIPANASHEQHGRAVAANAGLERAVATDPPVTGMDDQLQSPAATADHGGQPSSAQQERANMQQDMAPAGIYANAGYEHHGPAVAGQPTSHVYPAMAGMGTPLQQHFNTFVPTTSYGYGSLPPVGGNAMPPLSHSASPQYAGHMNLQQPRVPANLDPQQQHEIMHYLQLMQHQQMHRNVTLPSTPQTMGPSSGTPRPEDITTFTDVRMPGQNSILSNGVSSTAETVVSPAADPPPRTHGHSVLGESQNSRSTLSDEVSSRSVNSLSSLSQSSTPPEPSEKELRNILNAIRDEVIPMSNNVGKSYVALAEKIAQGEADVFTNNDEQHDDRSESSDTRARRHLKPLQADLSPADFECAVYSRGHVLKKMTEDYKSLNDSLSELQQHSIDGDSPTFGRVVKMLASLVPLLIDLEPYWKEPALFYHELAPSTKSMIDDTIEILHEVGRNIVHPACIILGSPGFPITLMEISVPTQMCKDAGDQLVQPHRDECQLVVHNAFNVSNRVPSVITPLMQCQVAVLLPAVDAIVALSGLAGDGGDDLSYRVLQQVCKRSASVQRDKRARRRQDVRNEHRARQQEAEQHRQELIEQDRQYALALQREQQAIQQQAIRMEAVRQQRRMLPGSQTHIHDFFSVVQPPIVNPSAYDGERGPFYDPHVASQSGIPHSTIPSVDPSWSPRSPSFSPEAEDDDASLSSSAALSTAQGENEVGLDDARNENAVIEDSHAEIAVHNGNLDGHEDQIFGGVNGEATAIKGQTSCDSPDASASVQHGDAQHSDHPGVVTNGIAVAPGGGDYDDGDDDDDQPPHDDRGGGGGPRGTPGGGDDGDSDRGHGDGPSSGGSVSTSSHSGDPDTVLWKAIEPVLEELKVNFQVDITVTTFGPDNRTRKCVTLTSRATHINPKYWSAALPALANNVKQIKTHLENLSDVNFQSMPPYFDQRSPVHLDGMLSLVRQGLQTLSSAQKTSTALNKDMVKAIRDLIATKRGERSQLRDRLDEFLKTRNTKIVGHNELLLFIQELGDSGEVGSIVRNLLLQRIPVAALQLNAPFLAESSSESMQELIESWILTRCAGKPLLQLDQVTMGGSLVGAPQNLSMVARREMLQAVQASHAEGTFADITRLTLLQPGMREPLSHFRQVEIQIKAVHESAVVHDESDSLEQGDGDDDAQSVLSGNSIGTTVQNNSAVGESFDLLHWYTMRERQIPENVNDDNSEELNPVSSQQVLQFLQDIHYMDSDKIAVLTLQAEVDRAIVTLILQHRDHQLSALKNISDVREESYSSIAAVQQQLKKALKGGSQNGGALTMLHCIAMADGVTLLQETPPLSLWEVVGSMGATINLLKILTVFYKASARNNDQAPVSQVVVHATKVLANKLGNLKLVEFKKQSPKTYTPVQIKPVYIVMQEVKLAIDAYMQKATNSRNSSAGLDAVLHDNRVLENLYEQANMASRALDTYDRDHQDGSVPQMREMTDVQAQLHMYEGIQQRLKQVRISKGMYMLRPNEVVSNNWGLLRALNVGPHKPVMHLDMVVPWIYSKNHSSKPENPNKPTKESTQPTKVRQQGSSFTKVTGAYPEVVNSVVDKAFSMKSDDEALFWVGGETKEVYTRDNIYMTQSATVAQDPNAGKVARKALVDGGDVVYLRDSSQKKNAGNGVEVMPVKPFLTHDRFTTIHAQAKLPGATLITIEELLSVIDTKFRDAERTYLQSVKESSDASCFLWTALLLLSRQDNAKPHQLIVDFGDGVHKPSRLLQPNSPSIRKPTSGKGTGGGGKGRGKGRGKGADNGVGGKGGKGQSNGMSSITGGVGKGGKGQTSSTTGGSPVTLRSGTLFAGRGNGNRVNRVRERIRMIRTGKPSMESETVIADVNAGEEAISTPANIMSSLRSLKPQLLLMLTQLQLALNSPQLPELRKRVVSAALGLGDTSSSNRWSLGPFQEYESLDDSTLVFSSCCGCR